MVEQNPQPVEPDESRKVRLAGQSAPMECPRCAGKLVERNRDGVLIDICVRCRGVWLDRGELEKLIALDHERWLGELSAEPS